MKKIILSLWLSLFSISSSLAEETLSTPAKLIFGHAKTQAFLQSQSVGSYAKGCLAGASALPINGAHWQVMRLSRNRNWGHPRLIAFLERMSSSAYEEFGWNGLMVGDLSQPRGGPMLTGHTSHQTGLDADIWFYEMPSKRLSFEERENLSAISMLKNDKRKLNRDVFTDRHHALLKLMAQQDEVARIFVFPTIKQALCEDETQDRAWLSKIRPWYGHHYHFHIRLKCSLDDMNCQNQSPPALSDGCGKELSWWLSDAPWQPQKETPPKPPLTLEDLPSECKAIAFSPENK